MIAVDGKAVRGAKNKEGKAPHLVAALAHGVGAVLGQAAVTAKPTRSPRCGTCGKRSPAWPAPSSQSTRYAEFGIRCPPCRASEPNCGSVENLKPSDRWGRRP